MRSAIVLLLAAALAVLLLMLAATWAIGQLGQGDARRRDG